MTERKEIPELTSELIDMSREYLRQETIEPAKRLGKHAGLGIGGAIRRCRDRGLAYVGGDRVGRN